MEGSSTPSSKPQFFKVLLPGFFKKLTIPRAFTKNISGDKCRRATLLSSLGKTWHVKILREAQAMHFGEGWQEFARAHRLGVGFFLLFIYEGNLVFTVTVFDLSSCKIDYNDNRATVASHAINVEEEEEQNQKNDEEMFEDSRKRPAKRSRECKEPEGLKSHLRRSGRKSPLLHFEVTMKKSFVCKNAQMNIPMASMEAFGLIGECEVILKDLRGKSWRVFVGNKAPRGFPFRPRLSKGWCKFVKENNLVEGDKCIFELVSKDRGIINVRMLKHSCKIDYNDNRATVASHVINVEEEEEEEQNQKINGELFEDPRKRPGKRSRECKEAEVLKSQLRRSGRKTPPLHFEVTMKKSFLGKRPQMHFPIESAEAFGLIRECEVILKDLQGKLWRVFVHNKAERLDPKFRPRLTKGWCKFVRENNLVEGDKCVFELMPKERGIINIRVLKQ